MTTDRAGVSPSPDGPLEAQELTVTRKGFDQREVRALLRLADGEIAALRDRIEGLERRRDALESELVARPEPSAADLSSLDEDAIVAAVGEEMSGLLRSAHAAARDLRARAAADAEAMVQEAERLAATQREDMERLLAEARAEAGREAEEIRTGYVAEAAEALVKAKEEAEAIRAGAERERRLTIEGAQAARERILADLARRRRVAAVQIEQLRAGRERLLVSYAVVSRTLEEVHDEFQRADAEARAAADDVGRRLEAEGGPELAEPADELDLAGGSVAVAEDALAEDALAEDPLAGAAPVESPAPGSPAPFDPVVGDVVEDAGETEPNTELVAIDVTETGPGALEEAPEPDPAGGSDAGAGEPDPEPAGEEEPDPEPEASAESLGGEESEATPEPEAPAEAPSDEVPADEAPAEEPSDDGPSDEVPPDEVTGLFERIRASQAQSVTEARQVLKANPDAPAAAVAVADPPAAVGDEELLGRRQEALAGIERDLTRRLKRTLQDEQNDLFDRLRSATGPHAAESLLPAVADHEAQYAAVARPFLADAAERGVTLAASLRPGADRPEPDVGGAAAALADELVGPLRRRVDALIGELRNEPHDVVAEALGSAYREAKTRRTERVACDQVAAAFTLGTWEALPAGAPVRWIAADADGPCADCDDNTLAGVVARGEPFPTGQPYPPAHAGCRCLLVPGAAVAAGT